MTFYIEISSDPNSTDLYLKSTVGHCHLHESVKGLLASGWFRYKQPELLPVFERANEMMERGEVGEVGTVKDGRITFAKEVSGTDIAG